MSLYRRSSRFYGFLILGFMISCSPYKPGDVLDEWNGVEVFFNGSAGNHGGRNTTKDGYNIGLKWEAAEFVKRYYLEYYQYRLPNPWGHPRDFFDNQLEDGAWNEGRGLVQLKNGSSQIPETGDIFVFDGHWFNKFGHVAIVCRVSENEVELIQQNRGSKTRETFELVMKDGKWEVKSIHLLGWLRLKSQE